MSGYEAGFIHLLKNLLSCHTQKIFKEPKTSGGGGGTPIQEAKGDMPPDGVTFSLAE